MPSLQVRCIRMGNFDRKRRERKNPPPYLSAKSFWLLLDLAIEVRMLRIRYLPRQAGHGCKTHCDMALGPMSDWALRMPFD